MVPNQPMAMLNEEGYLKFGQSLIKFEKMVQYGLYVEFVKRGILEKVKRGLQICINI
jgi:hypothetical protein